MSNGFNLEVSAYLEIGNFFCGYIQLLLGR